MKIIDPENLEDYVWMWKVNEKTFYQFMDDDFCYPSIVHFSAYIKSLGYNDIDIDNMKVELARKNYWLELGGQDEKE